MSELDVVHKHWSSNRWHSTETEKNFIRKIGTFSKGKDIRPKDPKRRLKLLIGYRTSIFERRKWGSIDVKEILKFVDALILEEKDGTL